MTLTSFYMFDGIVKCFEEDLKVLRFEIFMNIEEKGRLRVKV